MDDANKEREAHRGSRIVTQNSLQVQQEIYLEASKWIPIQFFKTRMKNKNTFLFDRVGETASIGLQGLCSWGLGINLKIFPLSPRRKQMTHSTWGLRTPPYLHSECHSGCHPLRASIPIQYMKIRPKPFLTDSKQRIYSSCTYPRDVLMSLSFPSESYQSATTITPGSFTSGRNLFTWTLPR